MSSRERDSLRGHLIASRLAGHVATPPLSTLTNCGRLVAGLAHYTFGLSDWRDADLGEAISAVRALCGGDPETAEPEGPGWIDPDACVRAISLHGRRLAETARSGGRILLATGHPTGLIPHYGAIARALQAAGCKILVPLDDVVLRTADDGRPQGLRYLDGVAAVFSGAALIHSHHPRYMQAMLEELGGADAVDLVVGDHGMAGAAIEAGISTLAIADVNDPALPLAQARGRTDAVLPIDDNLAPSAFVPVTEAMLAWA